MNGLEALEVEIRAEQAASLGRIGRKLDEYIVKLNELRRKIECQPVGARSRMVSDYNELRTQAERYFWYLTVQRESMGINDNAILAVDYVIPDPIR